MLQVALAPLGSEFHALRMGCVEPLLLRGLAQREVAVHTTV